MSKIMTSESNTFITLKDCKLARKELIKTIYHNLGVSRDDVALPWGAIVLCGYDHKTNKWLYLARRVYEYPMWIANENKQFSKFKLVAENYLVNNLDKTIDNVDTL